MSREEILRRFEEWLDGALATEEPPRGVEAEMLAAMAGDGEGRARPAPAAAYSMWEAMTALPQPAIRLLAMATSRPPPWKIAIGTPTITLPSTSIPLAE